MASKDIDAFDFDRDGLTLEDLAQEGMAQGCLQEGVEEAKAAAKKTRKSKRRANVVKKKKTQTKRKRTVSDDDDDWEESSPGKKNKLGSGAKGAKKKTKVPERSMEDFFHTIDTALHEERIDDKKASRLHECLAAGDWSEVAYSLLCENIPLKRNGKGYFCRICQVPKKGHNCPYCLVCSSPESKIKKDEEHTCFNCPMCFEDGKKRKKLVQINREGHVCPHETAITEV